MRIDLAANVSWMMHEGSVSARSFRQYLYAVRRFCEGEKMFPLPPTPSESRPLGDVLSGALKFEGKFPVKELKRRAGLSALNAPKALVGEIIR